MSKLAPEMLADLEKETVDFGPNYDESLEEPFSTAVALPQSFGQWLFRYCGRQWLPNIPPHNLGEVIDGVNSHDSQPRNYR